MYRRAYWSYLFASPCCPYGHLTLEPTVKQIDVEIAMFDLRPETILGRSGTFDAFLRIQWIHVSGRKVVGAEEREELGGSSKYTTLNGPCLLLSHHLTSRHGTSLLFDPSNSLFLLITQVTSRGLSTRKNRSASAINSGSRNKMSSIENELAALESATGQQRSTGYNDLLKRIISSEQDQQGNLVRYVQSITSDNIGVIVSRPLLSAFVEQFRALTDNTLKIEAG